MVARRAHVVKLALAALAVVILVHLATAESYLFVGKASNKVPLTKFFEGLEKHAVQAPSLKLRFKTEKAKSKLKSDKDFLFSKEYLENVLDVSDDTLAKLTASHSGFVHEFMPRLLEKEKIDTFGGHRRSTPEWAAYEKSKGYVLIGGGKYSWLSYLVIQQLRTNGAKLPIEVFIPSKKEYEADFCTRVLPKYGAVCNVLEPRVAKAINKRFKLGGYQYKMLALLTSNFENVMYLDSDLFPTTDVEYLFESDLYRDKGLLLWPDTWARTTNPKFHEIANFPVSEKKVAYSEYDKAHAGENGELRPLSEYTFADSNFHDFENALPDPSSEAGVLVVNKTTHMKTLLLALYYNIFGPNFYYPLLTQGAAGEGDKETFIAAATVMGEPYYQTSKTFKWVGYFSKDEGEYVSKGLGHYDPLLTHENADNDAPIIFMHCSYPKYYTDWFYENHDLISMTGEHIRMYESVYENIGYDLDLRLQQFFVQGACQEYATDSPAAATKLEPDGWAGTFLSYIRDDPLNDVRCREVYLPHLQWLKETTSTPAA